MIPRKLMPFMFQRPFICSCCSSIIVETRTARSTYKINPKEIEEKMKKFILNNRNLKKSYIINHEEESVLTTKSIFSEKRKSSKSRHISHSTMLREKNLSHLIRTEVQNLLDSGQLGEEVHNLNLLFTKSTMVSQDVCRIYWEPDNSAKDIEIFEILNGLSGRIRHQLMSSHVLNNVPTIQFQIDRDAMKLAIAERILNEQELDVGPDEKHTDLDSENTNDIENTSQPGMGGLNYDEMYSKLVKLKKMNKVAKS